MPQYILALDQGTTSSRAILFDHEGRTRASASHEFKQHYPQPGWVEHDATEIWQSQFAVAEKVLAEAQAGPQDLAAIGITNQRETVLLWDRSTGEPLHNAIVWQCRRTAAVCDRIRAEGFDRILREKTGLVTDAYFSGTKIAWLLENIPGARERAQRGELACGTIDTWLVWQLTRGRVHATDVSNASRTLLFNLHTLAWDQQILNYFAIPASLLPEVKPSSAIFGETSLFGGTVPIAGVVGDQQASLFGQQCFRHGMVKNTYGTGCFLLMNTGTEIPRSESGLLGTVAWGRQGRTEYALEGSVFIAGAAIQWLRDEMKLISDAAESEALARSVPDTHGDLPGSRLRGSGRTALGCLRARDDYRHHAGNQSRPPGASGPGIHCLSDARSGGRHGARLRLAPGGFARGWRRGVQRFSLPVSGRYSGNPRGASGNDGVHGTGRCLPCRPRHRFLEG